MVAKDRLITFEQAGEIIALHHTTFRQRKAGTESLTHVRMGRRVLLVKSEVEALAQRLINEQRQEDTKRKTLLHVA